MVEKATTTPSISADEVAKIAWNEEPFRAAELVASLTEQHNRWHEHSLNLVASHNLISPKAKAILNSDLVENASSGALGARSHSGTVLIDRLEALLVELAKKLFDVPHVEYRAPSGALANGLFIFGAMEPGEKVIALPPRYGGHYTYWKNSYPGVQALDITDMPCHGEGYPVIDLEGLAREAERVKPKWFLLGTATFLFPYPLEEIEKIAKSVGAQIFYDGAHILGLAAGGSFQDPLHEGAAVLTGSTQKTLPGPIGGLILMHDPEAAERVNRKTTLFISSYNNNRTAALAVTLAEMLAFGKEYASAVVSNAQALARSLDAEGFSVIGKERGFTRSHIVLVDMGTAEACKEAQALLEAAHISCSPVVLPRTDSQKTTLRIGSPASTRKGMGEQEMAEVARLIRRAVLDREEPARVGRDVGNLASSFTRVHYCF